MKFWRNKDAQTGNGAGKNLTEIVMILDRSGSMSGLEGDTIGGFNSMLDKQKKEEGEAYVSVVLFDDRQEVLYDRCPIQKVPPMTDKEYYVRGATALLDAVGGAIRHIDTIHRYARPEDVPAKTLFIITTDGMENASRYFTGPEVRGMIERHKEADHWEFLFLGANMDAAETASRIGIDRHHAATFHNDSCGQSLNYEAMSDAVSRARCAPSAAAMQEDFEDGTVFNEIRKDFARRK